MSEVGAPGAGASAPAPSGVPIDTSAPEIPNPSSAHNIPTEGGETSRGQPPNAEKRRSIDDALDKAFAHAEKQDKGKPEAKAKPEAPKVPPKQAPDKDEPADAAKTSPRERGDRGRFVSREAQDEPVATSEAAPHHEPPHRFSAEAKAQWEGVPDPVKAEIHRSHRELEAGLGKYKAAAEAYQEVGDFDRLARQSGTTLKAALSNYVGIESRLASGDPQQVHEALQTVFKRANIDPKQWAAHVLNQPAPTPDQREAEHRQAYTALQRELAGLKQQLHGVATTQHQQQSEAIGQKVTAFARAQPRFEELSAPDIQFSIQNLLKNPTMVPKGPSPEQRLQLAYDLADRLNPSSTGRSAPLNPEPRSANNAGQKSIAGSPANGSDPSLPARKGKHSTIDESLDRAFARAGL